jgi:hypothetical protein
MVADEKRRAELSRTNINRDRRSRVYKDWHGMPSLSILLLGSTDRAEFCDARPCLGRWGTVHTTSDLPAATAALTEGAIVPDVIVVAQAFPGQFSLSAIASLRRLAPLAPVVGLMGSWCEGEMRSGSPWPGTVRTYWHQWTARCDRQLRCMAGGECCSWTLPPTATDEERLLADAGLCGRVVHPQAMDTSVTVGVAVKLPPQQGAVELPPRRAAVQPPAPYPSRSNRGLIVIHAQSSDMAHWLAAACCSKGFATVWQRASTVGSVEGASAAIYDAADLGDDDCRQLQRLVRALRSAPVLVLMNFPRSEDRRRALSTGATSLLSKPLLADDVFCELDRVCRVR